MRHLALALLAVGVVAAPAAADLTIDRAIKKEPAYKGKPGYLLLAFGEKARDRVWLVHDGDVLYVDRDGDGDLTGKDEKVARKVVKNRPADGADRAFEVGELRVGGRTHKGLTVHVAPMKEYAGSSLCRTFKPFLDALKAEPEGALVTLTLDVENSKVKGGGLGGRLSFLAGPFDSSGVLRFAPTAKAAPVVHPDGPLAVTLFGTDKPRLTLGRANDLVLAVGAAGSGPGTLAMLVYDGTIPKDAHPKVEIAWPPAKPGEKPVREIYELKDRC